MHIGNFWGNRTRMNARLAIRQRVVLIKANISANKISLPQGPQTKKRVSSAWNRTQALLRAGPRRYHYATWEHKKSGKGALPPGIEPRTSYAPGHIALALASLH